MNVDEIKQALAAATMGPWNTATDKFFASTQCVAYNGYYIGGGFKEVDAHLIANAPTWISQLLEERAVMVEVLKVFARHGFVRAASVLREVGELP